MPNQAFATPSIQAGVAIELTKGTPATPAFWIPLMSPSWEPKVNEIDDVTLRGSMVKFYDVVLGQRYDAIGWKSYPYLDTFPVMIRGEFGSSDTLTAAPANTTLSTSCTAGAPTISSTATVAAGSYVVLDQANTAILETVRVQSVSGAGPFTLTLNSPTIYAHASAAAVTGLTKHQFSLLNNAGSTGNQPPGITFTWFDGEEWRQNAAGQMDKCTITSVSDKLIECDLSLLANPSTTPSAPTAAFTNETAPPAWTSQVLFGGVGVVDFSQWEFDFARGTKPIPAHTGTQNYFQLFAGPLENTGKISVIRTTNAPELTDYLTNVRPSLDITFFNRINGDAMTIHCTTSVFRTGKPNFGKEWVEDDLTFTPIPNTTDALAGGQSPCLITIANARTSAF